MRNNFENGSEGEGVNNNLKPRVNWNKIDHLIQNIIKGKKKKYIVLFLSLVSMIILFVGFIPMTRIITNAGSPDNNGIGISTVSFDLAPDQNPYGISEHIVGELYRAHNSVGDTLNMSMMNSTYNNGSTPGIVVLHGFGWGMGKEEMTGYCVELSKRGFIVLAIDLPQQSYTSGSKPAIFPHAEFDPYIINASINFLKALPYVNSSSIGLLGYSFGGASAAISAGVLGNTINATVIMNGFTNVTDWLLRGILPSMNITYHISGNELVLDTIRSADNPSGKQISISDMNGLVRAFNFIRGRSELAERIIIKNTTALNLTELSKMSAVNYLNNAAPNSLMFIHGIYDNTFDFTNQSEQGYNASINGAIYVPLNDKHYLIYNNDSLWATINFFKTRLLGYNISNSYTGAKHFLVATDNLGLNAFNLFDESLKIKELLIMLGALLPIVLNIYVIMYTKRFETERAEKIIEKENQITAFSGARFSKQIFGIIGMLASSFLILFIIGKGLDNPTLLYTLAGIFYVSMYFALIYTHDNKEIEVVMEQKGKIYGVNYSFSTDNSYLEIFRKENLAKRILKILVIAALLILSAYLTDKLSALNLDPPMQLDGLVLRFITFGIISLVSAALFIYYLIKTNKGSRKDGNGEKNNSQDIKEHQIMLNIYNFGLDPYSISRSAIFGLSIGFNFIVFYNLIVLNIRYPFYLGLQSAYSLFVINGVIIFSAGLFIWLKIFRDLLYSGNSLKNKIISEILFIILASIYLFLVGKLISVRVLNFGFLGNFSFGFGIIVAVGFIIGKIFDYLSPEHGILGISVWMPLIIIIILAFFLKI